MNMENQSSPVAPAAAPASVWSGIYRVFYEPSKFFAGLANKKAWLLPLLIIAVVGTIVGHVTRPLYVKDMIPVAEARIEEYRQYMGEERYNAAKERLEESKIEAAKNEFKWYYPLISLVLPMVVFSIIALVVMLFGKVIFKGGAGFWTVVNVIAFAALIGLLGDVFRGVMMLMKDTMRVYTGLGLLRPLDDGTFLFYLLRQIDAFSVWRIVATAIGLGTVFKMSTARFLWVLIPFWLIIISLVAFLNIFSGGSIVY